MKLQEFSQIKKINQVRRVFESHFGSAMSFDQLTAAQCRNMLSRVKTVLGENRRSAGFHTSEQNPAYLKLVMMEQALTARLKEAMPVPPGTIAAPGATAAPAAATAQQTAQVLATQKDPKVKAALEKAAKGQSLNPDEQKIVSGVALTKTESKLRNAYRMLKESEVQQAQVVLAAQDMVDKMQGMLEDVSELQFKELPALVDSIKNQVGIDQATQFNTDATGALTGLMQNLQGAKQQLDQALGVVTGQQSAGIPGMDAGADLAAAGADMAAGADAEVAGLDDLDAAADDAGNDLAPPPEEEELAPAAALGRGRR
jgi:hypothetical protein